MLKKLRIKQTPQNYAKMGMIAGAVILVAALGAFAISAMRGGKDASVAPLERALAHVSADAVSAADLRVAVVRMGEVYTRAEVVADLRRQRESFDNRLRTDVERNQKEFERAWAELEKSQGMVTPDALQRRVAELQQRIAAFHRSITERAQAVEAEYHRAMVEIHRRDIDPIIDGVIERKNLSMVFEGQFTRVSPTAPAGLDITDDIIDAMNKRATTFRMRTPQGF
ncbi:MAG: OmpH family outer membrane protein [Alphaproteobacteria bacterium]|nr:OmpH family outer membrane protein [Alphaproteobacteria bacterium]MCL2758259.1 OmpH family outer membrane protein [Alphaproteobacteria bacterium]